MAEIYRLKAARKKFFYPANRLLSKAIENKKDKTGDIGNNEIWYNKCLRIKNIEMFYSVIE
jgi:hypothetical protein